MAVWHAKILNMAVGFIIGNDIAHMHARRRRVFLRNLLELVCFGSLLAQIAPRSAEMKMGVLHRHLHVRAMCTQSAVAQRFGMLRSFVRKPNRPKEALVPRTALTL